MTEYGRIHTDGSRSGGQPVLKPCGHCGEQCATLVIDQGDKWAHYEPSCLEVRTGYDLSDDAAWRAEAIAAWNTRQPTQSDIEQEIQRRIKETQEQETFSSVRSRMKFRAKGQALSDLLGWIRKEQSK